MPTVAEILANDPGNPAYGPNPGNAPSYWFSLPPNLNVSSIAEVTAAFPTAAVAAASTTSEPRRGPMAGNPFSLFPSAAGQLQNLNSIGGSGPGWLFSSPLSNRPNLGLLSGFGQAPVSQGVGIGSQIDLGGIGQVAGGLCDLFPTACAAVTSAVGGAIGTVIGNAANGGGQQQQTVPGGTTQGGCPKGYHPGANGECVIDGLGSYIPGDVGKPDVIWTAVNGRYGAGRTPVLVQAARRYCPAGWVLGKDGVCYDRLPGTARQHNPGHKPFLTGGEMNALRTAGRLRKKGKKLEKLLGIHHKRAASVPRRKCK